MIEHETTYTTLYGIKAPLKKQGQSVVDRILALRRPRENDSDFAKRIGVSPQLMGNLTSGQRSVTVEVLARIIERTGADALYMLTGRRGSIADLETLEAVDEIAGMVERLRSSLAPVDEDRPPTDAENLGATLIERRAASVAADRAGHTRKRREKPA